MYRELWLPTAKSNQIKVVHSLSAYHLNKWTQHLICLFWEIPWFFTPSFQHYPSSLLFISSESILVKLTQHYPSHFTSSIDYYPSHSSSYLWFSSMHNILRTNRHLISIWNCPFLKTQSNTLNLSSWSSFHHSQRLIFFNERFSSIIIQPLHTITTKKKRLFFLYFHVLKVVVNLWCSFEYLNILLLMILFFFFFF